PVPTTQVGETRSNGHCKTDARVRGCLSLTQARLPCARSSSFGEAGRPCGHEGFRPEDHQRDRPRPGSHRNGPVRTLAFGQPTALKGSRTASYLNVNKNELAQVNYGNGRDVSDESLAYSGEPLRVRWYGDSFVRLPVQR